jgi:phage shock protein E
MKKLAAAFTSILLLSACSSSERSGSPTSVAVQDPKEAVRQAALVLDVRTSEEFAEGHLDRAKNIPVDEIEAHLDAIGSDVGGDKTKPIAVYCAAGGRAARAKQMLDKAGYTHVTNAGGYAALAR